MKQAVVLAGGKGRRLLPYTSVLPKPLMPVGDRPILEIVLEQLRVAGFGQITMAVGHLASLIQAYFGDGERFGLAVDYSLEKEPLGTAGPLSLLRPVPPSDFLVMNGDVLTDLDFGRFHAEHCASGAMATIAVIEKRIDVELGVLQVDDQGRVTGYDEKPSHRHLVSTGIYCFQPEVLSFLEPNVRCDLPALIDQLNSAGEHVRASRIDGSWLDLGRAEDYEAAEALYRKIQGG